MLFVRAQQRGGLIRYQQRFSGCGQNVSEIEGCTFGSF